MIVSHGRQFIFVHIPKTGGTSLALALENRAMKDDILIGDTPKARRRRGRYKNLRTSGRLWKHSKLADIDGLVTPSMLNRFFVVTLVRNPWDRMVSYYHWLRVQEFGHPAVSLARAHDFEGFLADAYTEQSVGAERYGDYVTLADGRERCDLFARLEHLDEDLAPFEAHLGFSLLPLPHENASNRPPDYRTAYSDWATERVARLCAADIARFDYRF